MNKEKSIFPIFYSVYVAGGFIIQSDLVVLFSVGVSLGNHYGCNGFFW